MRHILLTSYLICHSVIFYSQNDNISFRINDTLIVDSKNGRIEFVKIKFTFRNNSNALVSFKRWVGISESNNLDYNVTEDFCSKYDFRGDFVIFILENENTLMESHSLNGVGDFPYFTKCGNLKYFNGGGYDNPNRIRKQMNKFLRKESNPILTKLEPFAVFEYQAGIYLGDYLFNTNTSYYIIIKYNNKSDESLTKICMESNRMVFILR